MDFYTQNMMKKMDDQTGEKKPEGILAGKKVAYYVYHLYIQYICIHMYMNTCIYIYIHICVHIN
jgi:hypothetical protein